MEAKEMKPTMRLQWGLKRLGDVRSPAIVQSAQGGGGFGQELQQWWENDKGEGEWRTVPMEG